MYQGVSTLTCERFSHKDFSQDKTTIYSCHKLYVTKTAQQTKAACTLPPPEKKKRKKSKTTNFIVFPEQVAAHKLAGYCSLMLYCQIWLKIQKCI